MKFKDLLALVKISCTKDYGSDVMNSVETFIKSKGFEKAILKITYKTDHSNRVLYKRVQMKSMNTSTTAFNRSNLLYGEYKSISGKIYKIIKYEGDFQVNGKINNFHIIFDQSHLY